MNMPNGEMGVVMGRRGVLALLMLVLTSLLSVGCAREAAPPLRVASNVWPGYELLYLARERGYFSDQAVRMVELPSATVIIQALAAGNIEGACLTLDEVLTARAEGLELKVVAILDLSMGADALVVRPGIDTLDALRGRRIGAEQSAVGAVMLSAVLEAAGLGSDEVEIVHMNVNAHRDAYLKGEVDALITFEPVISQLADAGAKRLFDSAAIPGRIIDVIAFRPDALEANPEAVRALIKGHFEARRAWLAEPAAVAPILARRLKLPAAEVPAAYEGLELPDAAFNREWLAAGGKLAAAAERLSTIMLDAGLLPQSVAAPVDPRFLPRVGE